MIRDKILKLTGRDLDAAVSVLMGGGETRPYSSDMNAAWTVAEKLRLTVTPKEDATPQYQWLADAKLKGQGEPWWGFGPTAAIAICRAALLMTCPAEDEKEGWAYLWEKWEAGNAVTLPAGTVISQVSGPPPLELKADPGPFFQAMERAEAAFSLAEAGVDPSHQTAECDHCRKPLATSIGT